MYVRIRAMSDIFKERVKNVLRFRKPSRVIIIATLVLAVVLSVGFAVNRANDAIVLPDANSVLSITMDQYNGFTPIGEVTIADPAEINQVLNTLSDASNIYAAHSYGQGVPPEEQIPPEPGTGSVSSGTYSTDDVATAIDYDIRSQLYLGMTNEEVYALFGEPDYHGSGMMWYGYNDIGTIDPGFSSTGLVEWISLKDDGTVWSVYDLINTEVIQHNYARFYVSSGGDTDGVYPTQSHVLLALDADNNGFTAYIVSLYSNYVPDGEYDVREVGGTHAPLALTFVKNANGNYKISEYWEPRDGSYYMPSIRAKFPESLWDRVDTQLYIEANNKHCYEQAMSHFVRAIPYDERIEIRLNTRDAVDVTRCAVIEIIEETRCFLVKYFPEATLQIEPYDESHNGWGDGPDYGSGSWIIEYADSNKNMTIGRNGTGEIAITDDLIGIYDTDSGMYTMRFEKYTRSD